MSVSKRNALILSILHNPIQLKSITSLTIKYSSVSTKIAKLRPFLSLRLPILKFHNETLKIDVVKERNPEKKPEMKSHRPTIEIAKSNGETSIVYPDEMRDDGEIMESIVKFDQTK